MERSRLARGGQPGGPTRPKPVQKWGEAEWANLGLGLKIPPRPVYWRVDELVGARQTFFL
jgi:hypothetical protein